MFLLPYKVSSRFLRNPVTQSMQISNHSTHHSTP